MTHDAPLTTRLADAFMGSAIPVHGSEPCRVSLRREEAALTEQLAGTETPPDLGSHLDDGGSFSCTTGFDNFHDDNAAV